MKYVYFILLFLQLAQFRAQKKVSYELYTLKNGLKVHLLRNDSFPSIESFMMINTGKKNQSICEQAYTEIIAQLIQNESKYFIKQKDFKLTALSEGLKVSDDDNDFTTLAMPISSSNYAKELKAMSKALSKPVFNNRELDTEIEKLLNRYDREKVTNHLVDLAFRDQILYGTDNSFGANYCQFLYQKISLPLLKKFYQENYFPDRSQLFICGPLDAKKMKEACEKAFSNWKHSDTRDKSSEANVSRIKDNATYFMNIPRANKFILHWIKSAPAADDNDFFPFSIATRFFMDSLACRLDSSVRFEVEHIQNGEKGSDFMDIWCETEGFKVPGLIRKIDSLFLYNADWQFSEKDKELLISLSKKKLESMNEAKTCFQFFHPGIYDIRKRRKYESEVSQIRLSELNYYMQNQFGENPYILLISGNKNNLINSDTLGIIESFDFESYECCQKMCEGKVVIRKRDFSHFERPRWWCPNCVNRVVKRFFRNLFN